jgi:hypothetical protein
MAQQGAFAAAAAAHDDENVSFSDGKREVFLQYVRAKRHCQVIDDDWRRRTISHVFAVSNQMPRTLVTTADSPSATTIQTIAVTTADVAAAPTAAALRPH